MTPDEQKKIAADYRAAFHGPQGERVLKHLASHCFEDRRTFVEGSPDRTAYNEGRRSVLLGIRNMLKVNPNEGGA